MAGSYSVHGESITDGDASGGVAVTLYDSGSPNTVRVLLAGEVLHITDIQILCETGGDVWLVADSKAAGRYLLHGTLDAKGEIIKHYSKPYVCPHGTGLKFYGVATNINSCIIEGFIEEA